MTGTSHTRHSNEIDLERAMAFHRAGRHADAELLYRSVLYRDKNDGQAQNLLGLLLVGTGRPEEGLELMRRSVKRSPRSPHFHLNLAEALQSLGRLAPAEDAAKRAVDLAPSADSHCKLGIVQTLRGRLKVAIGQFERATAHSKEHHDAWHNLGSVHAQLRSSVAAIAALRMALVLAPARSDTMSTLAGVFQVLGQFPDAVSLLRRALDVSPAFAPAHINLGNALDGLGERENAFRHLRRALSLRPEETSGWMNLGNTTQGIGHIVAAETAVRRALTLSPRNAEAWGNLGRVLTSQGRFREALSAYHQALRIDPSHAEIHSNILFLSHFDPDFTPERIRAEHIRFGQIHAAPLKRLWRPFANTRHPDRRLRVGYVSADFGRHPVGYFLKPVLLHHDQTAVEVLCYSDRAVEDDLTAFFRTSSSRFRRVVGMTDESVADLVRADGVDILVDLAGHTGGNRLLVFARKPAPVQVSWLGYYDTTGIEAIDAVLADPWEVEPGDEEWFVEDIVRLSSGRLCYGPPEDAPTVSSLPAIATGNVTFGSFNNLAKLTDHVVGVWTNILTRVPGSSLKLRTGQLADRSYRDLTAARFRRAGLDPSRLDLDATTPRGALKAYGTVDIALDPFPFPGGLTTCEALWMGVPVVTLRGTHPVSRQSISFLSRIGLAELVAVGEDGYVGCAVALADDLERLAILRHELRPRIAKSPMTDGWACARAIEDAYRHLWRKWCER